MWAQDCRFCEGFADVAVLVLGFEGAGNEGKHKVNITVFQICTQFRGVQQVDVHTLTPEPYTPCPLIARPVTHKAARRLPTLRVLGFRV